MRAHYRWTPAGLSEALRNETRRGPEAGWTQAAATLAGLGEGIERHQPCPLPGEEGVEASYADWPLDEPALGPESWVLFHPEQHAREGFPFRPFTPATRLRWTSFRDLEGEPRWILSYAFNIGFRAASCRQILKCDADIVVDPRFFDEAETRGFFSSRSRSR